MPEAGALVTWVIIPAYNEEACVATVVEAVVARGMTCVVVDDGSQDRTADRAASAGAEVIRLPINLGVGGALRAVFRDAVARGADRVIQVDADGQHPVDQIDALLDVADRTGADLVIGSRFAGGAGTYEMSTVRRSCIRLLSYVIRRRSNVTVSDPTSGFRVISKPLLTAFAADFPAHYLGDTFEAYLMAARRGYRIVDTTVVMRPRQGGTPSADLIALIRSMIRAIAVQLTGSTFDLPPRTEA